MPLQLAPQLWKQPSLAEPVAPAAPAGLHLLFSAAAPLEQAAGEPRHPAAMREVALAARPRAVAALVPALAPAGLELSAPLVVRQVQTGLE